MTKIKHGMIMAAGFGTRMRPITNTIPKPLVSVDGRCMLDRNIDALEDHGVETIVVNGHYLIDVLADHLTQHSSRNLVLSSERDEILDQGGGIKHALPHLGENDFFVLNGDAFWREALMPNLQRLEDTWNPAIMDALLMVAPLGKTTGYDGVGDFTLDTENKVAFRGEAANAPYVFTGVGIYKTETFAQCAEDVFPLVPLYKQLITQNRLFGLPLEGHWFHIGTPHAIGEAEAVLAELDAA